MTERRVRQTAKDTQGDITALCHVGEAWSPRLKADAIDDIEGDIHRYYVEEIAERAYVHVVNGPTGKYLRTTGDSPSGFNLGDLPDYLSRVAESGASKRK